jgi:Uma2 family endonuclease
MTRHWSSTMKSLDIFYPESDGRPMADNTEQFRWIVYIKEGMDWLFADRPDVFVAGDLLWYPVQGDTANKAPDTMVVFGRPKGKRGSYIQHRENSIAPQVVFEVRSPSNTRGNLIDTFDFYQEHGVEEYYLYDPDAGTLKGYFRSGGVAAPLVQIAQMEGWESPRLGVRFGLDKPGNLQLWRPDGNPFESYQEIAERAQREAQRADLAERQAEQERERANQERRAREQSEQRAQAFAERLKALGIDPDSL